MVKSRKISAAGCAAVLAALPEGAPTAWDIEQPEAVLALVERLQALHAVAGLTVGDRFVQSTKRGFDLSQVLEPLPFQQQQSSQQRLAGADCRCRCTCAMRRPS